MVSGGTGRRRAGWRAVRTEVRSRDPGKILCECPGGERTRRPRWPRKAKERATAYAEQGRQQVGEYVDRGKEYYDRGRTQWSQYVDKGKNPAQEHQNKVAAAIDAGKQAHVNTTSDPQT